MAVKKSGEDGRKLRRVEEAHLGDGAKAEVHARSAEELLHELQVHQIELEMQNAELRRAQQVNEESRDRYLDLYDFAPIGYLTLDRAAVIVEANRASADLFGFARNELLNRQFMNFVSAEDREHWLQMFANKFVKSMNHGEKLGCELALRRADGSRFHARLDCLRMERGGEQPVARIAVTDITERHQVEEALRQERDTTRNILQTVEAVILALDTDGRITLINRKGCDLLGWSEAELIGRDWFTTCLPQNPQVDMVRAIFRKALVADLAGSEYFENPVRTRSGEERLIAWHNSTILDAAGKVIGGLSAGEDITERKRALEALRESQADLSRAQTVGQIGSWRFSVRRNELLWSSENHRIFGVPKGTPLNYETFLGIVHADDREYVDHMWEAALHGSPYDIEHRLVVNGTVKWVREKAELEFDPAGQLRGAFGTTQDITGLKLAEQALIEADKRKDEFLAMLGHELRNPLAPILNAAHVLGRLETREPQVGWARKTIERQVVHLTRLVDDLLDVSRIVRGKVVLQQQILVLGDVVEQALDMARPLIEARRHRIELRLPEMPVWLRADPVRLAQVLLNLLDNAAKYTPEGGRIELAVSVTGRAIEIRLHDNGIGIPDDLRPHVFDLFQQGERGLDRAQGGLGIGLTLAKRLVELHGGLIEVASAGAGLGSEFTIWLPVLADDAASAADQAAPKLSAAMAGCRVLVVDDDSAVAESMTALLAIEGHDVRTAASGETALALARDFRPRLVLLDIGLNGMDGYEVARRLRGQQGPDEKLCLVAVTGYGHEEARTRARQAGFDRHLVKPVDPEAICQLLSEVGAVPAARN